MISTTPMGPGFFIFFQTTKNHAKYGGTDLVADRRRREEEEIIPLLIAFYETGVFK